MTYLQFHLIFNLPVLGLLLWLTRHRLRRAHWRCLAILGGIVLLATAPWDNWAVHRGMWAFDPARVTPLTIHWRGVAWSLPVEEYAYFLVETMQVALLAVLFLPRAPTVPPRDALALF